MATRNSAAQTFPMHASGEIPGDIQGALDDISVPSYVVDQYGVIRWLNPAA